MSSLLGIAVCIWIAIYGLSYSYAFAKYRKLASKSGWPGYFSPVHVNDLTYLFTHKLVASGTRWLPQHQIRAWFPWTTLLQFWHAGYQPFENVGSDSFFLSSASGNMLLTSDPAVCTDILRSSSEFRSPIETLHFYNIYGPSMAACKEADWRRYRKISMPYFSRETTVAVWRETIAKTQQVLKDLGNISAPVKDIKSEITARVTLGVISKVFFGRDIGEEDFQRGYKLDSTSKRSFGEALLAVINDIGLIIMARSMPLWLTRFIPSRFIAFVDRSYHDFKWHMQEMHRQVSTGIDVTREPQRKYNTLLESLVRAGNATDGNILPSLSQDEVFGNIFFFILAGYDNTSNATAFALLLLALHQDCQQEARKEVDGFVSQQPLVDQMSNPDFQQLFDGYLGAVIKETLHLYHPVEWMPRRATSDAAVTDSAGKLHIIPKDTTCVLDFAAMFRSPKHWSTHGSQGKDKESPALQFEPSRWLNTSAQQSQSLPSAYIPFSTGQRACPGKRFAEAQIHALVACIISEYSVELVMGEDDRREAELHGDAASPLEKLRERAARSLYEDTGFNNGIYPSSHFPIRFVKRTV